MATVRERLHRLYFGDDAKARKFCYALICFDVVTIAVSLISPLGGQQPWMIALDLVIGALLSVEFLARLPGERTPRPDELRLPVVRLPIPLAAC